MNNAGQSYASLREAFMTLNLPMARIGQARYALDESGTYSTRQHVFTKSGSTIVVRPTQVQRPFLVHTGTARAVASLCKHSKESIDVRIGRPSSTETHVYLFPVQLGETVSIALRDNWASMNIYNPNFGLFYRIKNSLDLLDRKYTYNDGPVYKKIYAQEKASEYANDFEKIPNLALMAFEILVIPFIDEILDYVEETVSV